MKLITLTFYKNFGQEKNFTISNVIADSIWLDYTDRRQTLCVRYDVYEYGMTWGRTTRLELGETFTTF